MKKVLVTGGAGFFAEVLAPHLRDHGNEVVLLDKLDDPSAKERFPFAVADLTRPEELGEAFRRFGPFEVVFHLASVMGHEFPDPREVWKNNVEGTKNLAEACAGNGVRKIVYTSSICVFGRGYDSPVSEEEPVNPVEVYGRSKLEGEKILSGYGDRLDIASLRCPTIVSAGRLGLLAILFEFIQENRRVYLVGEGANRYQFVDANDLAEACRLAGEADGSALYNVGADNVVPLRDVYQAVIDHAGSKSRLVRLPRRLTTAGLQLLYKLGVSPLGPYHYRMISESFIFDTARIKETLGWKPKRTGQDALCVAYDYWLSHRQRIGTVSPDAVAPHKRGSRMGIIRLVKWLS
jgi:nucleoside-diphosphate-sugar epimerase